MVSPHVGKRRRRCYVVVAVLLALWAAILLALNLTLIPDVYWYSYYAIDYTLGFLRRGLAGELVGLLPGDDVFLKQRVGRWVSSGAFFLALAVLAWWIAVRSGRSERRLQLALLVAVLPFGFAFGLLQAGSTLFGATALIGFGVSVARARSDRSVLAISGIFGVVTVVLVLVHEAIPLLFGLGVIAVLVVLANQLEQKALWASCALALGPGLVTALVVAVLGKHGIADELCALIPHAQVSNPLAGKPTLGQLLSGFRYYDDYHDWACRNITPFYNRHFVDGIRYVGRLGAAGMIVNTVFGVGVLAITILAIGLVSGVPPRGLLVRLRQRWLAIAFGFCLTVPVFMTGVDWVRWWVSISLDIGLVYLLYVSRQPELDRPPTRRSMRAFIAFVIALALIPVGIVPAFLAPLPI
ncbi:hypothetical protein [Mycolicibacterium sp.]|uniref:hypothetical protein n=1 Tax=Mycolicibacterium sp. TaxID=2320850 RepID=UPI001A277FF1|nr:hypothetical protein [Mycolicibacterium sp.]MBJ7399421.1 hypothetical protein [Mycolicibacterium sp.]